MKKTLILIVGILILSTTVFSQVRITGNTVISGAGSSGTTVDGGGLLAGANVVFTGQSLLVDDSGSLGATITATATSCDSSGICIITAPNTYIANQWVDFRPGGFSPSCLYAGPSGVPYYGTMTQLYEVLSTGLSSTQFEVQTNCPASSGGTGGTVEDATYFIPVQTVAGPGFKGINMWYLRNDVINGLLCNQALNFTAMYSDLFPATTGKPLYFLDSGGVKDIMNGDDLPGIEGCFQSFWSKAHAAGAYVIENNLWIQAGSGTNSVLVNNWLAQQGRNVTNVTSGQYWDFPGVNMAAFSNVAINQSQIAQAWNAAVISPGASGFVLSGCTAGTDCAQLDQANYFTQYQTSYNDIGGDNDKQGGFIAGTSSDNIAIASVFWNSSLGAYSYLAYTTNLVGHYAMVGKEVSGGGSDVLPSNQGIGWYSNSSDNPIFWTPVIQFSLDPSGNYINVGNGTIGDYSKSLKLTGIMGQVTAPSGSCTANGLWELTQDGALTRCLSSVWTPFGIGGSGSYQPLTLVSTTDPPIATCDSTHNVGTLATSTTLSLYQCSNNNSSATYVWNVLASSTVAFTLTTSGSGPATYSGGVLNIPISSSGGGLSSGQPLVLSNISYQTINGFDNYTIATQIPSALVLQSNGSFKIQIQAVGGTGISINSAWIFATNPFSLTTLTSPAPVQITWNGGSAAYATAYSGVTTTSPFILNSDSVTFPIDYTHDYYVFIYLDSDSTNYNSNLVIWNNTVSGIHGGGQRGNTIPSTSGGTVIPWSYTGNVGLVTKIIVP